MQNQPFPQFHRLLFTWNHTSHIFLRGYDPRMWCVTTAKWPFWWSNWLWCPIVPPRCPWFFWEREIGAQEPGVLSIGMLLLLGRADSAFWLGCRRRSNYEAEMRVSKTSSWRNMMASLDTEAKWGSCSFWFHTPSRRCKRLRPPSFALRLRETAGWGQLPTNSALDFWCFRTGQQLSTCLQRGICLMLASLQMRRRGKGLKLRGSPLPWTPSPFSCSWRTGRRSLLTRRRRLCVGDGMGGFGQEWLLDVIHKEERSWKNHDQINYLFMKLTSVLSSLVLLFYIIRAS